MVLAGVGEEVMVVALLNRLVWSHPSHYTLTCMTHQQHTRGGADCGVAIIIVADVHMDLGDGGGGRDINSAPATTT